MESVKTLARFSIGGLFLMVKFCSVKPIKEWKHVKHEKPKIKVHISLQLGTAHHAKATPLACIGQSANWVWVRHRLRPRFVATCHRCPLLLISQSVCLNHFLLSINFCAFTHAIPYQPKVWFGSSIFVPMSCYGYWVSVLCWKDFLVGCIMLYLACIKR